MAEFLRQQQAVQEPGQYAAAKDDNRHMQSRHQQGVKHLQAQRRTLAPVYTKLAAVHKPCQ